MKQNRSELNQRFPSEVVRKVNENFAKKVLTSNLHVTLYKLFSIRPPNKAEDPFETNAEYCLFDETHNDYVYQDAWIEFLVHFFQVVDLTPEQLRAKEHAGDTLDINHYKA